MANGPTALPSALTRLPTVKYVVAGLLVSLLLIAVGHLFVLEGTTARFYGLPTWVWLQLVVVTVMLAIAWLVVELIAAARVGVE